MILAHVQALFQSALANGAAAGCWPEGAYPFSVSVPKDAQHGDFAINVAMAMSRTLGRPPRELAAGIIAQIRLLPSVNDFTSFEVAGPGFINVRLALDFWFKSLERIEREGTRFGRSDAGHGKRVLVEYVSANPTGPMHVGHGRNAVVGDGVAAILDWSGHQVTREYYVNDAGAQVQTLARSVHLRYQELAGRKVLMPPKSYPGEYVVDIARELRAQHGDALLDAPEGEWIETFTQAAISHVLTLIRGDLEAIGVHFDRWYSEQTLYESGAVDRFLVLLEERGLIYRGLLPLPKTKKGVGAPPPPTEDGETESSTDKELMLFRSSQFGDEVDRPVKKADGTPTYFCADIAYHWDKRQRADALVNVLGADHAGYVPRIKAALAAIAGNAEAANDLHVVLIQMVNLTRNGEAVKMSKRAGTVVSLREVVEEVGRDATRFSFLTRRSDAQLDFDLDLAKKHTLDNPVFYVQYGHARLASILRKAAEQGIALPRWNLAAVQVLKLPQEQELIRKALALPDIITGAALAYEPHRIAFYLQEIISQFHAYYTAGKASNERVIGSDPLKTAGRLVLCAALKQVIANGLSVLGVSAPERLESRELENLVEATDA